MPIFPCFISRYFAKVAALFYSVALGAKRKYMRWLFALFIVVSCWTNAASGNTLLPFHPTPPGVALFALNTVHPDNYYVSQGHYYVSRDHSISRGFSANLRLQSQAGHAQWRLVGVPAKKNAIKNRLKAAPFTGSVNPLLLNNNWPAAYFAISRNSRADEIYKQPRQSLSLVNYSNWIFHASTQQNRVGGWKESNTQYSGMLTYHHYDAITFMLS